MMTASDGPAQLHTDTLEYLPDCTRLNIKLLADFR